MPEFIKVKSGEYKILDLDYKKTLYTLELNDEIATVLYSLPLKKVALARNVNAAQIQELLYKFNEKNLLEKGIIKAKIIGGDESESSKEYFKTLVTTLNALDKENDLINVIGCSVGDQIHPNSFGVDSVDGSISTNLNLLF